jgi:hypothetical protein
MTRNKYPLFDPGQCVATPGAIEAFQRAKQSPLEFLRRHIRGDWGELPAPDKEENEIALEHGHRIFSAYYTSAGTRFWIITEADRSVTTLLLPNEY